MKRQYLGTIAEKDGCLCLQTAHNVWFPLAGSSGVAADFREAFNEALLCDVGKQVFRVGDVIQMENAEQMRDRLAQKMPKYRCFFSAARNVVAPNYYNTDRFGGRVTVQAENETAARHAAIDEVYRLHGAENVGHVIIKETEREPD